MGRGSGSGSGSVVDMSWSVVAVAVAVTVAAVVMVVFVVVVVVVLVLVPTSNYSGRRSVMASKMREKRPGYLVPSTITTRQGHNTQRELGCFDSEFKNAASTLGKFEREANNQLLFFPLQSTGFGGPWLGPAVLLGLHAEVRGTASR